MTKLRMSMLDMPLSFEANRGQADANVKFVTRAQNFTVFLTPAEAVLRGRNGDVLRMKLRNASQAPQLVGEKRQAKVSNYYIGNDRSKWLTGVPNYGEVRYQNVYSGIDMVYHSDQRQLEYDFVLQPGADPNQIRVMFEGATKVLVTDKGELELKSATGETVFNHVPVIYQTIDGRRKVIDGGYAMADNKEVGFRLGEYDRTQPLVIDPSLQVLAFFGGNLNDEAAGVATSAVQATLGTAGVVFVGRSESATLPPATSPNKPNPGINWDAFATGLNAGTPGVPDSGGTTILWTTYFGGIGDDAARGVAMDNQGNVYVSGYTNSSNFPAGSAVNYDAFIVKLSAAGGGMTASTLYGGNGVDQATSIALDYSTFSNLPNALSIINPATDPAVTPNVVIGGLTTGGIGGLGSPTFSAGPGGSKTPDGSTTSFRTCTATGAAAAGCGTLDGFVAIFNSSLG
ncbi:MAG: SBBP repeat-containing protein, partial [Acidobacteriia bacterium]|nr:SBBP repeat-containing protein [Terriglobia bacterium]